MKTPQDLKLRPRRKNSYPPPTDQHLAEFERENGVILPSPFVVLLKTFNGGLPSGKLVFETGKLGLFSINDFYGLGPRPKLSPPIDQGWEYGNLWDETRVFRPFVGMKGVPFARDGGSNQFFLDFDSDPPAVGYLHASSRERRVIFKNFESFFRALRYKNDPDE